MLNLCVGLFILVMICVCYIRIVSCWWWYCSWVGRLMLVVVW